MKLRERDVSTTVVHFLEWHKWRVIRNNVMAAQNVAGGWSRAGEVGMPDHLALYYFGGRARSGLCLQLWIEFKAPGKLPTPQQEDWQAKELNLGGLVWTVDNFEEFERRYQSSFGWLLDDEEIEALMGRLN